MDTVFIDELSIKNFRCFRNESIKLPDGETEGSQLNIFVGEDGNGKTTILEAINYLTQNKYSSENKLAIGDFSDFNQEITITAKTPQFICKMSYVGNYYESCGVEFIAKSRNQKSPGKLLSTPFQIRNCFINVNKNYKNSKGEDSGKVIDERFKVFSNSEIKDGEFNIFYFDSFCFLFFVF